MKVVKLTKEQNERRCIITKRLWELRREEDYLQEELKNMGIEYNLMGQISVKVEILEG